MPPPADHPCLQLELLPQPFYVKQLQIGEPIPVEFLSELNLQKTGGHGLFSITRTREEISIVGEASGDGDWRCIKIAGPMEFSLVGVLASFTAPLRTARVPVFAISTWNTDYVLVPKGDVEQALDALKKDGWQFAAS